MAKMVVESLLIDINTTSDYFDRSDIKLSANSNIIELRIYAKDLISAKASINTSLKWIENSINIIEMFSN